MPLPSARLLAPRALLAAVMLYPVAAPVSAATPDNADVRVLIDISGSMRQNDPDNLRRPALRMLAGLLQPGTRAGVWTFARWINNLVPVAEVDAQWKARAQSLSRQINSPGQFTNIEEVLDKASSDWSGAPTTHERHLVLLTDGMVDISKQAADNERSRTRILEELLPRLQDAGVKLHTIALSERADHELMQRLAGETGGWYQQVAAADELQRAFLRMFETVGEPDALPLQDNRFVVDGSISEATVLVFSRPDSPPVVLHSPSGESYEDSDLPAGVAWFRDQGYDLITVASPQKGEWRLQADVDPDNRVMVVTDLKLRVSDVPSHIAVGEQIDIEAHLSNHDEPVTRPAFLRLLDVRAVASTPDGRRALAVDEGRRGGELQASAGLYGMTYAEATPRESVELLVAVDSPTFMREKRLRLAVHAPFSHLIADAADGPVLTVDADPAVLHAGATVDAWQEDAQKQRSVLEAIETTGGQWSVKLPDAAAPVFFSVSATTRLGNRIEHTVGPLMAPGSEPPAQTAPAEQIPLEAAQQTPEPAAEAQMPAEVVSETETLRPPQAETVSEPGQEEQRWLMPAILFLGFNMLLIGGGVWWFLGRRSASDDGEFDLPLLETDAESDRVAEPPVREHAA
jgi:hypothetical protein